ALASFSEHPRAHERRQRQRDQTRGEDGHDDRDRKLAEDASHEARQQHEGKENGRERDGHGKNREADFFGAVERGRQGLLAALHTPDGVFQKDDRVIDQEADRQSQGHQREVVEAVAQRLHGDKRQQKRKGESYGGGGRVGRAGRR